jgi:hypothetical protein
MVEPMKRKRETQTAVWPIWAAVAALGLYAALIAGLWYEGVFQLTRSSTATEVLTAVLALIGGLFAAIVTFVGVLVKYSLDARTLELAHQTEDRLTVETLFKGVELLTGPDGKPSPPTQQAAALFALASGGYLELSLMHLSELWPAKTITTTAALRLTDIALSTGDERSQLEASRVLRDNAPRLPTPEGDVLLPLSMDPWNKDLPEAVRENMLHALLVALMSRPRSAWKSRGLVAALFAADGIRKAESEEGLRDTAVRLALILTQKLGLSPGATLTGGDRQLVVYDVIQAARDVQDPSDFHGELRYLTFGWDDEPGDASNPAE